VLASNPNPIDGRGRLLKSREKELLRQKEEIKQLGLFSWSELVAALQAIKTYMMGVGGQW